MSARTRRCSARAAVYLRFGLVAGRTKGLCRGGVLAAGAEVFAVSALEAAAFVVGAAGTAGAGVPLVPAGAGLGALTGRGKVPVTTPAGAVWMVIRGPPRVAA